MNERRDNTGSSLTKEGWENAKVTGFLRLPTPGWLGQPWSGSSRSEEVQVHRFVPERLAHQTSPMEGRDSSPGMSHSPAWLTDTQIILLRQFLRGQRGWEMLVCLL